MSDMKTLTMLSKQPANQDAEVLAQFEEDRRRQRAREQTLGNLK